MRYAVKKHYLLSPDMRYHTAMHRKKNTMIKAIVFDLGKVIVDFDHVTICKRLATYCSFTPEQIYARIFTSGLEAAFDEGNITPLEFFHKVKESLNLDIPASAFKNIWNAIFSLNPGISVLIEQLKKDYRLLCLSNTNLWHFSYCMERFPVLRNFNSFILSYEVKKRKPNRKIFAEAIKKAGVLPSECLYIDDLELYIKKAREMGMNAVHFTSLDKLEKELKLYLLH